MNKEAFLVGYTILQKYGEEASPVHHFVTGPPGAGKTTLADELGKKKRMPVIHGDDFLSSEGSVHQALLDALKELEDPHIVEGVQVLGLTNDELGDSDVTLLEPSRRKLIKRLLRRGWESPEGNLHGGKSDRKLAEKLTDRYIADTQAFRTPVEERHSDIHGKGLFATKELSKKNRIPAFQLVNDKNLDDPDKNLHPHYMGRLVNHSDTPNLRLKKIRDFYYYVPTRRIKADEELTADYRTFPWEVTKKFLGNQ